MEGTSQDGHVSQASQDPLKKATPSENFDNIIETEDNNISGPDLCDDILNIERIMLQNCR